MLSPEVTNAGGNGIGIGNRDYVVWEVAAETLEQMRAVKRLFDPNGILNPGKSLPGI